MFLQNVFPPLPSEVIMPLAGFAAAEGGLNIIGVILAGSLGSVAGALIWYYMGRLIERERLRRLTIRYGRLLTVGPGDFDRAFAWFQAHGGKAVFLGQLIPAVRTLISVPAGIFDMHLTPFLIFSALGTVLWTGALAIAGYVLGEEYHRIAAWISPVSDIVVGLLVLIYLYRLITFTSDTGGSG